jgi:hypothetical protein
LDGHQQRRRHACRRRFSDLPWVNVTPEVQENRRENARYKSVM